MAYSGGRSLAESLAERFLAVIEDPPPQPIAPPTPPSRNLEAELLAGGANASVSLPSSSENSRRLYSKTESDDLAKDFEQLLLQRERLRAQLIAETERRERAEAELVSLGAQWLGTDTQVALAARADAERRRSLDHEKAKLRREADQRIAAAEAEVALLRGKLGTDAPAPLQLRMQLRAAMATELEQERQTARAAVREQLEKTIEERDALSAELRRMEAMHHQEVKALATSVRRASELLQEQYDKGFVQGLQQAAQALSVDAQRPAQEPVATPSAKRIDPPAPWEDSETTQKAESQAEIVEEHSVETRQEEPAAIPAAAPAATNADDHEGRAAEGDADGASTSRVECEGGSGAGGAAHPGPEDAATSDAANADAPTNDAVEQQLPRAAVPDVANAPMTGVLLSGLSVRERAPLPSASLYL